MFCRGDDAGRQQSRSGGFGRRRANTQPWSQNPSMGIKIGSRVCGWLAFGARRRRPGSRVKVGNGHNSDQWNMNETNIEDTANQLSTCWWMPLPVEITYPLFLATTCIIDQNRYPNPRTESSRLSYKHSKLCCTRHSHAQRPESSKFLLCETNLGIRDFLFPTLPT